MKAYHRDSSAGFWVGFTVCFLLASLSMVQLRCKFTGGFPCGDWPKHGYTWHFWPSFLLFLFLWFLAAQVWSRRRGRALREGLRVHGEAASPMLGLVLAWAWYGLTGPQFHYPNCTVPLLCHDTVPFSVLVWSLPWLVWGGWRLWQAWGSRPAEG